jgi:hypothetical protein
MNWYQQLFQTQRWPRRLPHYGREETGFAEMLVEPNTGLLDQLNIGHTGIRRRTNGPYSAVVFRDPDNNQLEFAAPAPPDADS